ncbi:MAG: hypothetical protein ABSB83_04535 [Methanomassiliicoccales archaeon]|jgi:hypothetical protein
MATGIVLIQVPGAYAEQSLFNLRHLASNEHYILSADMVLPPDTDDKSGDVNKLETEDFYKKFIEPALLEMTGLIDVVQKRCSCLENEIKQLKSQTDTLMILNLGKADKWQRIPVG